MFGLIKNGIVLSFSCICLLLSATPTLAQDVPSEYQDVLKILDRKGDFKARVLKVNIPRNDLKMTVQSFPTPTPFGFGGWIALTKATDGSDVMMGDLVLTVKIFDGTSLQLLKTIEYGDDADNLRYNASRQRIYVGYGSGALAELEAEGQKLKEIKLDAHPESFQLEKDGSRIYVNLPKSRKVAVVDREKYSVVTTWGTGLSLANYPMALDESDHRLFVVTRLPARLLVIDTESGKTIQKLPAVGDCDDVFFDQARKRIYASGGEGAISVFEQKDPDHYAEVSRIPTVNGARTSFYSPDFGRLYLAVRRQGSAPAMIQVFEVRQ